MRIQHWWFTAPLRLRSILRRRRVEHELDQELQFHLDCKIEEGLASGLSPQQARYRALRAMQGLEQKKEEMRDLRRIHWLTDFADDLKFALRSLRRTPAFAAFVILTLALGAGMGSATFPLFDGLVLRPWPILNPSRVVTLVTTSPDESFDNFSYREYLDVRDQAKSYQGVVASKEMEAASFRRTPQDAPRVKGAMLVSGNYFRVLGVQPSLGRGFREDEDRTPGRDAVVVLSATCWKAEFASNPSVLGTRLWLNGVPFTVVGVTPQRFTGMELFAHPDLYVPLAMAHAFSTDLRKRFFEDRDDRELSLRARLRPGATIDQARGELAALANRFALEYPKSNRSRGAAVHTDLEFRTRADASEWKFSLTFVLLSFAVLLVACTNVAGLLLTRARTRAREIAIRLAIGSGRFRLIRMLLTESFLLASLGGLGGLALGFAGVKLFASFQIPSDLPFSIPVRMDLRVLAASFALTCLSALLCGLAPAWQSTSTDLVNALKTADADLPGQKRLWGRSLLVVTQVATSLMLLAASFLMVRGFQNVWLQGVGFPQDHLLMASFDLRLAQYDGQQSQQFYKHLAERLRHAPGVRSAAVTENIPLGDNDWNSIAFVPEGFSPSRDRQNFTATIDTVDEGYFETMQIPIVQGRGFSEADTSNTPRVAVVNEQFARHYWPGVAAVGQRIRLDSPSGAPVEIIGIARTTKYHWPTERPLDFVYLPLSQRPVSRMVLMLRSAGDPMQLTAAVKAAGRSLAPNLPMRDARTYESFYQHQAVQGPWIAIRLVSTMGAAALLLSIAGLYGLIAYNVNRRTREIGVRIAIGAAPSDVLKLVMRQGVALAAIGTAIGLPMGLAVERLLDSMIFGSGGIDLIVYAAAVPLMILVTLLAAYVPARRASRIAPTLALRQE